MPKPQNSQKDFKHLQATFSWNASLVQQLSHMFMAPTSNQTGGSCSTTIKEKSKNNLKSKSRWTFSTRKKKSSHISNKQIMPTFPPGGKTCLNKLPWYKVRDQGNKLSPSISPDLSLSRNSIGVKRYIYISMTIYIYMYINCKIYKN